MHELVGEESAPGDGLRRPARGAEHDMVPQCEGIGPDRIGRLSRLAVALVEACLDGGVAIELSTAGLRKPVGELYPSRAFLEMAVDAGIPIALSSDAHTPDHLAFGYDAAVKVLQECGVKELAVFEQERSQQAAVAFQDPSGATIGAGAGSRGADHNGVT